MPSSEEIVEIVKTYAASQSSGDLDAVVSLFAPDAVVTDPVHEPAHVGHDAIRAFFSGTRELLDVLDLQITGPIRAVDRYAAVPLRAVSTLGGSKVAVDIIDVFTFGEDGLICDMKAYWDPGAITAVD